MRIKVYKKTVVVLMTLLLLTMIGCGKKEEATILTEDVTYEDTETALEGIKGETVQYCMERDMLYILTSEDTVNHFYTAKKDGSNCVEVSLDLSEGEMIDCFVVMEDGNIICLTTQGETDTRNELVKFDVNGAEVLRENITESLQLAGKSLIPKLVIDNTGNVILASSEYVYILDSKLQSVGTVESKNKYMLVDLARTKDGQVVFLRSGGEEGDFCLLDISKKKWGKAIDAEGFELSETYIMDGLEYDFYLQDGFGIFGYSVEEKMWTKVLDARCSFLTYEEIEGMALAEKGKFFSILNPASKTEKSYSLKIYSKMNIEELNAKQTITIASYNIPNRMREVAKEFNKQNKDYRIEVKIYEDEEQTRLFMDIMSGEVPDIIDIPSLGVSTSQLLTKGLLEDLTPYYEKDYETYTKNVIPSVLEGLKVNDKLYSVAPCFSINSAVGRTSDVGNRTGWTFEEMKEVLAEKGEDVIPFFSETKSDMLYDFLQNGLGDFVDWNTGKCTFDSQEFKEILELCNGGKEEDEGAVTIEALDEEIDDIERRLQDGKVLLIGGDGGISLEAVQLNRQKFGEDITYIGYPNKDRQGSYFEYLEEYGIYSGSKVKDKAWEFLRMLLTEEYQVNVNHINYYWLPTNQKSFNWKVKAKMATQPYTDEYGNEMEPIEVRTVSVGDKEIKVGPLSQEDVDIYVDLIEHTTKRAVIDEEMLNIVYEEAQVYFEGVKSLDETADIIQNRISTYVNEQR